MKLIHGGDIYSFKEKYNTEALDYSANINPLGMPQGVKNALIQSIDSWANYPDPLCRELKSNLAIAEKVNKDYIILGNGAADVIYRLVHCINPKEALVLAPTFSEYEEALSSVNCNVNYYLLKEDNNFSLDENILEYIDTKLDVLFICNPNNPTGELINIDLLDKILEKCSESNTLLVIDECFNDFIDYPEEYTMKSRLNNENLFILKAFTKIYAMAGLRLGYGLTSDEALINKLNSSCQPWTVSIPAQIAGIQALKEKDYLEQTFEIIRTERKYLKESLNELGFKCFGSNANYIFFKDKRKIDLKLQLENNGIIIRDCSNYKGLCKGYYRICIKEHTDNKRLITEIRTSIGD